MEGLLETLKPIQEVGTGIGMIFFLALSGFQGYALAKQSKRTGKDAKKAATNTTKALEQLSGTTELETSENEKDRDASVVFRALVEGQGVEIKRQGVLLDAVKQASEDAKTAALEAKVQSAYNARQVENMRDEQKSQFESTSRRIGGLDDRILSADNRLSTAVGDLAEKVTNIDVTLSEIREEVKKRNNGTAPGATGRKPVGGSSGD